jgi:EAL domain-containing protein (putative c-di-GMP-specific phosphodiesterase class I)/GGDEF domain-containing protein
MMFAFAALSWIVMGLVWPMPDSHRASIAAAALTALVVWIVLLRVHRVSVGWCVALGCLWLAQVSVLVWAGHGGGLSVAATAYFVPIGVFAALYFEVRSVIACQVAIALCFWIALWAHEGVLRSAFAAVIGAISLSTASFAVVLLMRSSRHLGTLDPDTGLPNGLGMAQRLAQRDPAAPLLVLAVVLRGINSAQEALGFQAGIELLRRAVEDIGQVLPSNAIIGRIGDELMVAQPMADGTSTFHDQRSSSLPDSAVAAAELLARTVASAITAGRYFVDGVEVSLRVHAGLSVAPWDGDAVPELFRRASLNAREAVANGATELVWNAKSPTVTADDLVMLADLGMAAERGELSLAFQPEVNPRTGEIVSVEALLRWRRRSREDVPPAIFIPLAERTGLINRLTEWVLPEALDTQARWRRLGIDVSLSVNLSPVTLTRQDLAESILQELRDRSLPASCLTLEITETAVTDLLEAVRRLTPLREAGVRISVDDFGSGYTSLSALPHLPLDELKVDMQFVQRSRDSPIDRAIIRSIIELSRSLGLQCVAEGVETEELYGDMASMGFDLLQGYFIAKPMREDDLVRFVHERPTLERA